MKKKSLIIIVFSIVLLAGCQDDFLDRRINTSWDEKMYLNSGFGNLKALGMGVYNYLGQFSNYGGNAMLAAACDEADYAKVANIQRFNTGAWGPFSNPDDVFDDYYRGIRHANLFLEKTVDYKTMIMQDTIGLKSEYILNLDDFTKLRAEVRFLRAYFYMELIKRYGGVPIIDKVLTEEEAMVAKRNSFDECIDFIVNECDAVYPILTESYFNYGIPSGQTVGKGDGGTDLTKLGRVEKPAAVALKLRALLYAASPLNNPTKDTERWIKAANAGQAFLSDPNCAIYRFLGANYQQLFNGVTQNNLTPRKGSNSGIIFSRPYELVGVTMEKANYPIGLTNGGGGCTCPSQNLVDAYETKNGLSITDDPTYDPNNPYINRDPRLLMTVVVNGSVVGKTISNASYTVASYVGGADGIGTKAGATTTGYYLRKMLVDNFNLVTPAGKPKSWVLMRYAEVLLNYAEAMNEAYGPDVKGANLYTAREAVNLVRDRSGVKMPPIPIGLLVDVMREKIQNERRIELAFEEQRFFDVRRWKTAELTENKPLLGMKVTLSDLGIPIYEKFTVEPRIFDASKMYRYPIPYNEVAKSNGSLIQNDNW